MVAKEDDRQTGPGSNMGWTVSIKNLHTHTWLCEDWVAGFQASTTCCNSANWLCGSDFRFGQRDRSASSRRLIFTQFMILFANDRSGEGIPGIQWPDRDVV